MKKQLNTRITLALLWVALMVNMIFNDIFTIIVYMVKQKVMEIPVPFDVTIMMAIAAIITNIPIVMIILSYVLKQKINRIINISAAVFTIIYVIGGGSLFPHYIVVAAIEVILAIIIIVISARWKVQTETA